jgi:RHS repeat-associated protein
LLESYRAWNDITDYIYFGGRLLYTLSAGQAVTRIYSDRLGSTRATETMQPFGGGSTTRNYYPFGEEITSTSNDQYKFASTYRDSATGLDYALNRYYASGTGRFITADGSMMNERLKTPSSWNRYLYVDGDPVNFSDPTGEGFWSSLWNGIKAIGSAIGSAFSGGGGGGSDSMAMEEVSNDEGDGGGGGTPYVTSTINYQVSQPCAEPNFLDGVVITGLSYWAAATNQTVGLGVGASGTIGNIVGYVGNFSSQLVVSPNGQAAFTITSPGTVAPINGFVTPGAGGSAGFQISVSNASTPQQLQGYNFSASYNGGAGFGGGVELSLTNSAGQLVYQATATLGVAAGNAGGATVPQYTSVIPVCRP